MAKWVSDGSGEYGWWSSYSTWLLWADKKFIRRRRGPVAGYPGSDKTGQYGCKCRRLLRQVGRQEDHQRRGHLHSADGFDHAVFCAGCRCRSGKVSGSPDGLATSFRGIPGETASMRWRAGHFGSGFSAHAWHCGLSHCHRPHRCKAYSRRYDRSEERSDCTEGSSLRL